MAEAEDQEIVSLNPHSMYYCHHCSKEVTPSSFSPELLCPDCSSSFIEEIIDDPDIRHPSYDPSYESDFGDEDLPFGQGRSLDHRRLISGMFNYLNSPEPTPLADDSDEEWTNLEYFRILQQVQEEDDHVYSHEDDIRAMSRLFEDDVDTIASQLLDEVEISGPPPLSKEQIKSLPVFNFATEEDVNDRQCTICMNDFKVGEKAKKLECKHLFHEKCIAPWLAKQASCPNCRSVVQVESKDKHCPNCPRFLQTGSHSRSRSATRLDYFSTSLNPFRLI